jgi:hypothetical protein
MRHKRRRGALQVPHQNLPMDRNGREERMKGVKERREKEA